MTEPEEMTAAEHAERVRQRIDSPEEHWPNEARASLDALTTQIKELEQRVEAAERIAPMGRESEIEQTQRKRADHAEAQLAARDKRIEALEGALDWLSEFADKMSDRHTGFVHVERRARAALARTEERTP